MDIFIKNMVCDRCIRAVTGIFEKAGIGLRSVRLGIAETSEGLTESQVDQLKAALEKEGFEWLDDKKVQLVNQVKKQIVELVHYGGLDEMRENLSAYLSAKLNKDYHYLTQLFSSLESTSIEQYFILQKIEKVKEWLVYGEFSLSEMAFKLGYSSVAHLSSQFKRTTGITPSQFKQLKEHHRKPLDKI